VDSCNEVTIHFAGLASTKFSEKPKNRKLLNLVLAKFMHIKVVNQYYLLKLHGHLMAMTVLYKTCCKYRIFAWHQLNIINQCVVDIHRLLCGMINIIIISVLLYEKGTEKIYAQNL